MSQPSSTPPGRPSRALRPIPPPPQPTQPIQPIQMQPRNSSANTESERSRTDDNDIDQDDGKEEDEDEGESYLNDLDHLRSSGVDREIEDSFNRHYNNDRASGGGGDGYHGYGYGYGHQDSMGDSTTTLLNTNAGGGMGGASTTSFLDHPSPRSRGEGEKHDPYSYQSDPTKTTTTVTPISSSPSSSSPQEKFPLNNIPTGTKSRSMSFGERSRGMGLKPIDTEMKMNYYNSHSNLNPNHNSNSNLSSSSSSSHKNITTTNQKNSLFLTFITPLKFQKDPQSRRLWLISLFGGIITLGIILGIVLGVVLGRAGGAGGGVGKGGKEYAIRIGGERKHDIPKGLYGIMFEDIRHSGDGGIYPELLQNRAFQALPPYNASSLYPWVPYTPTNSPKTSLLPLPNSRYPPPAASGSPQVRLSMVNSDLTRGLGGWNDGTGLNGTGVGGTWNGGSVGVQGTTGDGARLVNSLRVDIPNVTDPVEVGFGQGGYWGMKLVPGKQFNASFWVKLLDNQNVNPAPSSSSHPPPNDIPPSANGDQSSLFPSRAGSDQNDNVTFTLSLVATDDSGIVRGRETVDVGLGLDALGGGNWTKVGPVVMSVDQGQNLNPDQENVDPQHGWNNFTVTFPASGPLSGRTLVFGLFSLFPRDTFKGRENGMHKEWAQTLQTLQPSFFRMPGGNNLEGHTPPQRWIWNNTIGPLVDRPGRMGDWGYPNTDGLGLMEYLNFCEDMGMECLMGVYAGYSLSQVSVPQNQLEPYINAAIDQINFVVGDANANEWAALRAKYGHPEPYNLTYIEIGNEDFFSNSYGYRWPQFYNKLSSTFPQLKFIATTVPDNPKLTPDPKFFDLHYYDIPQWFVQNSFLYDTYPRDNQRKYAIFEYAVTSTDEKCKGKPMCGRQKPLTMQASSAEACYMTGLERNSDIIFGAAYGILAQNVEVSDWTTTALSFNASTMVKTTSWWVQQMFSTNLGDYFVNSTLPEKNGPVHWSTSFKNETNTLIIKVANAAPLSSKLTITLPQTYNIVPSSGTSLSLFPPHPPQDKGKDQGDGADTLSPGNGTNTIRDPNRIGPPVKDSFDIHDGKWEATVEGWGVMVLLLDGVN